MSFNDSLSKEQEEYFKNSVIRDDNGGLLKVYHGTTEQTVFRSFDSSKIGVGNGTGNGAGFNFTDSLEVANNYATHNTIDGGTSPIVIDKPFGHIYEVYLNIQHPLSSDDVTLTKEEMTNAFYNAIGQFESMAHVDYDSDAKSEASDKMVEEILSKGSNPMHTDINVLNEITESVNEFLHSNDDNFQEIDDFLSERYIEAHYDEINEAYGEDWDTEDILGWDFADRSIEAETNKFVKDSIGYDGFKGTMFGGGNVYVALEPDQIKAVNNLQPTHSQDMFENYPIRKEHNGMNIELYNISVDPESPLRVTGQGGFLSGSDEIAPGFTMDEVDSFSFDYNMKTNGLTLGLELNEPDIDNFDSDEEYYEALDKYRTAQPEFDQYDVPEFAEALRNELMDNKDLIQEFNGSINQGDVEAHRVEDDKYLTVEGKIHMGDTVFDFKSQNSYAPEISYRDSLGEEQPAPPWVMMHTDLALAIEQEYESLDVSYDITRNDKGLYDIKGEIGSNLATPFSGTYDPDTRELKLEIDMEKSHGIYEIKDEIKEEIKEAIEDDIEKRSKEPQSLSDKIFSKLLKNGYNTDLLGWKFRDVITDIGSEGVDLSSDAFKEAWIDAYNRAEDIAFGPTQDQSYISSLSPDEEKILKDVTTFFKEGILPVFGEGVTPEEIAEDRYFDIDTLTEIIADKLDAASKFNLTGDLESLVNRANAVGIDLNNISSDIEDVKNGTINTAKIYEHIHEIKEAYKEVNEHKHELENVNKDENRHKAGMDI